MADTAGTIDEMTAGMAAAEDMAGKINFERSDYFLFTLDRECFFAFSQQYSLFFTFYRNWLYKPVFFAHSNIRFFQREKL